MRIRRFDMTVDFLKAIFGPGRKCIEVVRNALPEDAELVRIHIEPLASTPDVISLFFTSKDFPDVPEGFQLMSERIEFRQYISDPESTVRLKAFS